jgi:hypothetical protein
MNNNFLYTNTLKNKDIYIFIICNNFKKKILEIQTMLNIKKIPKKILDSCHNSTTDFENKLYTDDFIIYFYGIGKNNNCDNEKLYKMFGKLGKENSSEYNKKILINIEGDNENIIKNQVASYILGFYNFDQFILKTYACLEATLFSQVEVRIPLLNLCTCLYLKS